MYCIFLSPSEKKLAGGSFYSVDGQPYCESDYLETVEKCNMCNKPIMERVMKFTSTIFYLTRKAFLLGSDIEGQWQTLSPALFHLHILPWFTGRCTVYSRSKQFNSLHRMLSRVSVYVERRTRKVVKKSFFLMRNRKYVAIFKFDVVYIKVLQFAINWFSQAIGCVYQCELVLNNFNLL